MRWEPFGLPRPGTWSISYASKSELFDNAVLIDEVVRTVEDAGAGWTDPVPALFEPRFRNGER
jgi:hypothetical protein